MDLQLKILTVQAQLRLGINCNDPILIPQEIEGECFPIVNACYTVSSRKHFYVNILINSIFRNVNGMIKMSTWRWRLSMTNCFFLITNVQMI